MRSSLIYRRFLSLLAAAGLGSVSLPVEAGTATAADQEYRVTRWTVENGLPQNCIRDLAQTSDGYLWFGTLNGLARFDGMRFKVFDHSTTPEMTNDSINDLAVDKKTGGLWIGTGAGLLYYENHQFLRFGKDDGIAADVGVLEASREGACGFRRDPEDWVWGETVT